VLYLAVGVAAIVVAAVYLRTQAIDAKFWIDEGLSVGIGHHSFFSIPSVLRKDGSPPLYYMTLHVWMSVVGGDGEARVHALSVACATLTVPIGWLLGRRVFGPRAGWASAALLATCPFLTYYAQEARMYAMVALMGLLASGTFALAFALRERWAVPAFGVSTVLMAYTHNWGLFLAVGLGVAFLVLWRTAPDAERRPLLRDGVVGFGIALVLYAPWIPTLLFQARHTAAPWSERPPVAQIFSGLQNLVGGGDTALLVTLLALAGVLRLRGDAVARPQARAALGIGIALAVGVVLAWLSSQASPAWATRYFSVFVGPALLLVGAGLVRFGKVGLLGLLIALLFWFSPRESQIRGKSDAYRVARTLRDDGWVAPGDLVVAAHPEQGPLMRYYMGGGLQWADALGPVKDAQVFDWRDALDRLKAAKPRRTLDTLVPEVHAGQHLILILPIIRTARWGAPWTEEVRKRSAQWENVLDRDPRFERLAPVPDFRGRLPRGVRAVVYLRL
jgi:uncharacterized membrane protein